MKFGGTFIPKFFLQAFKEIEEAFTNVANQFAQDFLNATFYKSLR